MVIPIKKLNKQIFLTFYYGSQVHAVFLQLAESLAYDWSINQTWLSVSTTLAGSKHSTVCIKVPVASSGEDLERNIPHACRVCTLNVCLFPASWAETNSLEGSGNWTRVIYITKLTKLANIGQYWYCTRHHSNEITGLVVIATAYVCARMRAYAYARTHRCMRARLLASIRLVDCPHRR